MTPEEMAALLGQAIREGVFPPGSALIQEDLAKRFNVSRNPVREALRILAAEGSVAIRPGGGATVRILSASDLEELYDLRLVLEPQIAPHVVSEARNRDIDRLSKMVEQMANETDIPKWMRQNFEFHTFLYAIADRPTTESILRSLLSSVQPYSHEHIDRLGGRVQAAEEHFAMVKAIKENDAEQLSDLFVLHLQTAKERLIAFYSKSDAGAFDPLSSLRVQRTGTN
jgi:DNA-binding GntR family transcriptional regulator